MRDVYYRWIAEPGACEQCAQMEGLHTDAPLYPRHRHCRCTLVRIDLSDAWHACTGTEPVRMEVRAEDGIEKWVHTAEIDLVTIDGADWLVGTVTDYETFLCPDGRIVSIQIAVDVSVAVNATRDPWAPLTVLVQLNELDPTWGEVMDSAWDLIHHRAVEEAARQCPSCPSDGPFDLDPETPAADDLPPSGPDDPSDDIVPED